MADIKISQLPAASALGAADTFEVVQAGANRKATGAQVAALTPRGYIDGLSMEWVSGTSLRVTSGAAFIPGRGSALELPSAVTKSGLSLAANTWYHVYLFDNAGNADVEVVTTAPAAPYIGTARTKTGDDSRRYVGSVLTDASANIYNFQHQLGGVVVMRCPTGSGTPFRVLSGSATSYTLVSCAAVVPPTCRMALMKLAAPNGAVLRTTAPGASNTPGPPSVNSIFAVPAGVEQHVTHPLSEDLQIAYWCDSGTPSGNAGVYVYGYLYER